MILENAFAFYSCGVDSGKLIQCPAGGEGAGDPTGEAEEAPVPPRGKQVSAVEVNGLNSYTKQQLENGLFQKQKAPYLVFSKTGGNAAHK